MTAKDIEKKLTERQWRTIALLKEAALKDPNYWVSQQDIIDFTPASKFDGGYSEAESTLHDKCTGVWLDIKAINDSNEFDTIIIYKDFKAKLATHDEALEYIAYIKAKAMKLLKRMGTLNGKLYKNNYSRLEEESSDLDFIQSVIDRCCMKGHR